MALTFLQKTKDHILENKVKIFVILILAMLFSKLLFFYSGIFVSIILIGIAVFGLKINKNFMVNTILIIIYFFPMRFEKIYAILIVLFIWQLILTLKMKRNILFMIIILIIGMLYFKFDMYDKGYIRILLINALLCGLFFTLKGKNFDEYFVAKPQKILLMAIYVFFLVLFINLDVINRIKVLPEMDIYKTLVMVIFFITLEIFIFTLLENLEYDIEITDEIKSKIIRNIIGWIILFGVINLYFMPIFIVALWPLLYLIEPLFRNINIYCTYGKIFFLVSFFLIWMSIFFKKKAKIVDYGIFLIYFFVIGYGFLKIPVKIELDEVGAIKIYLVIISLVILTKFLNFSVKYLLLDKRKKGEK